MSRPSIYHPSLSNTSSLQTSQSSALQARIAAKKAELENLKQLRDLSATLATQMKVLEQKLSTLRDGTESIAHVLANWENVLGVIALAGAKAASVLPREDEEQTVALPETLVRIPVQDQVASQNTEGD